MNRDGSIRTDQGITLDIEKLRYDEAIDRAVVLQLELLADIRLLLGMLVKKDGK